MKSIIQCLKFATLHHKSKYGKTRIANKLGSGSNASAFQAQIGFKIKILKKINKHRCKIYCLYKSKKKRKCILGGDVKNLLGFSSRPLKTDDPEVIATQLSCVHSPIASNGAKFIVLGNEFITEYAVSLCLERVVNPFLPYPVFSIIDDAWTTANHYNFSMDYAGISLDKAKLSLTQLKSVVLQILLALERAQNSVYFKHHDLHPGNVFVKFQKVPELWNSFSSTTYRLPDCSVSANIIDYGLSAATDYDTKIRYARVDYSLLDIDRVWGNWNHKLDDNNAYDISVFLYILSQSVLVSSHKSWLKGILSIFRKQVTPKLSISRIGRPLSNNTIDLSKFISLVFKNELV